MTRSRLIPQLNLILTGALLGLVTFELLFGSWFHPDPFLNLNVLRNVDLTLDLHNLYDAPYTATRYKRDQFGLRGNYPAPHSIDILTVGGSTTDQIYISEGETWQDRMRDRFAQKQLPLSVVNVGVDGHSTLGHLAAFERWFPLIPDLRVRYYLFYVGHNDMVSLGKVNSWDGFFSRIDDDWLDSILRSRSILYRTIGNQQREWWAAYYGAVHAKIDWTKVEWTSQGLIDNYAEKFAAPLQGYADRLARLLGHVHKQGARAIFVTQPSHEFKTVNGRILGNSASHALGPYTVNGVDVANILSLINETTLRVCRESGSICIDLARELSFSDGDFYDHIHNTPQGTQKIGDFLFEKLQLELINKR